MKLLIAIVTTLLLAPLAMAQGQYVIKPGDILRVTVLEDPNLNSELLVRPDGGVSMLIAGNIQAAGQTVPALQQTVTNRLAGNFANRPNVSISLASLAEPRSRRAAVPATIDVFFLGEVGSPGLKQLAPGTTMLQALAQGGGLGKFAAKKRIQLRRTDKQGKERVYNFNYADALRGNPATNNFQLMSGDVILVPERGLFN